MTCMAPPPLLPIPLAPHWMPPCRSSNRTQLAGVVAGLVQLLREGSDSGAQAAARAVKNLAAGGHSTNSSKVR